MVEINPLNRNIADSNRSNQPLLIEMRTAHTRERLIRLAPFNSPLPISGVFRDEDKNQPELLP